MDEFNDMGSKPKRPLRKLGTLKTGQDVVDRPASHLPEYLRKNRHILREALSAIELSNEKYATVVTTFSEEVGHKICVPTEPGDEIIYAQRPKHKGLTRFVKGKETIPTDKITFVFLRDDQSEQPRFLLITAHMGEKIGYEPWDQYATEESKEFWKDHALVWGEAPVIEGTETTKCPW